MCFIVNPFACIVFILLDFPRQLMNGDQGSSDRHSLNNQLIKIHNRQQNSHDNNEHRTSHDN